MPAGDGPRPDGFSPDDRLGTDIRFGNSATTGPNMRRPSSPGLVTFDLDKVNFVINWPDGGNQPGNRVQVTVNYQYQPLMPLILGTNSVPLQLETTMDVAH